MNQQIAYDKIPCYGGHEREEAEGDKVPQGRRHRCRDVVRVHAQPVRPYKH